MRIRKLIKSHNWAFLPGYNQSTHLYVRRVLASWQNCVKRLLASSVRIEQLGSQCTDFMKAYIYVFFESMSKKFNFY